MQGIPLDFMDGQRPSENLPFDSAARLSPRSAELEACTATLQHYLELAAVEELPADTEGGLCSTFFPVAKKNTTKTTTLVEVEITGLMMQHVIQHLQNRGEVLMHLRQNLFLRQKLLRIHCPLAFRKRARFGGQTGIAQPALEDLVAR